MFSCYCTTTNALNDCATCTAQLLLPGIKPLGLEILGHISFVLHGLFFHSRLVRDHFLLSPLLHLGFSRLPLRFSRGSLHW